MESQMRIIICDDNIEFAKELSLLLKNFFNIKGIKAPEIVTFYSGEDLLNDKYQKDIVFLDIQMPGIDGLSTGHTLYAQNNNVNILIITSYSEYLDDAMRFNVFRYISKPLNTDRLYRNLSDAIEVYYHRCTPITLDLEDCIKCIPASDIVFLETQNRKICIHTTTEDLYAHGTIKEWTKKLNLPCFFTSHRSFIVNLTHVTQISHDLIYLDAGKYTAYLSQRKFNKFKNTWLSFIEKSI